MDTIFLLEMGLVAIIVLIQFLIFYRNSAAIQELARLFPEARSLQLQAPRGEEQEGEPLPAPQLALQPSFSEGFRAIVEFTNAYLLKTRGQTELDALAALAKDKVQAHERAISTNLALPLYIGLLCTFSGVIVGLVKIALIGVSEGAIQSFIGGVLIGMVGSASGLALTVLSKDRFKRCRRTLDRHLYDYLTFLRLQVLPAQAATSSDAATLSMNLSAFNEGFAKYQRYMNESLTETLRLFSDLKDVFGQIRLLDQGLQSIGHFVQSNDGLIERQVDFLNTYIQKAETLTQKLARHYAYADLQLETLVAENMKALDQRTQAAYAQVEHIMGHAQHEPHNGNGHHFGTHALPALHDHLDAHAPVDAADSQKLLDALEKGERLQASMLSTLEEVNQKLGEQQMLETQHLFRTRGFRWFLYLGMGACIVAMLSGGMYLINVWGS